MYNISIKNQYMEWRIEENIEHTTEPQSQTEISGVACRISVTYRREQVDGR